MESIYMRDLPKEERPRERLIELGPEYLANRELLALLIRTGTKSRSAMDLADMLLAHFGSLPKLASASYHEISGLKGIGPAKAADILAAFELAKRLSNSHSALKEVVTNPKDAADLVFHELRLLDKEHFLILMLNTKHRVIAKKVISIGHLNASLVHPREMFKEAIKHSSAAVILVHNHPSGDPSPSEDDIRITRRLVEGGQLLGIQVLDHVIVGEQGYVSLKEKGLI